MLIESITQKYHFYSIIRGDIIKKLIFVLIAIIIALVLFLVFAFEGFGLGGETQGTKATGIQIEEGKIPLITIEADKIYINGELVSKDNLRSTLEEMFGKIERVEIDYSKAKRTTYLVVEDILKKLNLTIIEK